MVFENKFKGWIPAFAGMTFLAVHVYLGLTAIRSFSPTYDEPVHLTSGFAALKQSNYVFNGSGHPPFGEMWTAVPLLFSGARLPVMDPYWIQQKWTPAAQYRFADKFIYHNTRTSDQLIERGRMMQLALSAIFILLFSLYAFQWGGLWLGSTILAFGSLSSTWIAHGTLISTDLAFAGFFFLFFFSLNYFHSKGGAILSGVFLALCATSKFSVMLVAPIGALIVAWNWLFNKQKKLNIPWLNIGIASASTLVVLCAVYRFPNVNVFVKGIQHFFLLSQAGRSSFFMGQHGTQGWISYFPTAFLLKTEIPLLLSLILALFFAFRRKLVLPATVWIPPLAYFAVVCFSKVQIGHRHLLAIYPFAFFISACALSLVPIKWRSMVAGFFIAWMGLSAFTIRPHFLSYFNELIGGPKNGYQFFTDSNVDWGQGLKELGSELEPSDFEKGIYLSYFGVSDPHSYGIKYLDIASDILAGHEDDSRHSTLSPLKFAISATNLQSTYYVDKDSFAWLKMYEPWKVVAHSIFVYDFSNHPEALEKLKGMRTGYVGAP